MIRNWQQMVSGDLQLAQAPVFVQGVESPKRCALIGAATLRARFILQRELPVSVWGTAEPGAHVDVHIQGQSASCVADDQGNWRCALEPLHASDAETLEVAAGECHLTCSDVAVGEVFIAGGQSNMEFWMRYDKEVEEYRPTCTNPRIRFYDQPKCSSVRFKLADALVNGKLLRITGGTYRIADTPLGGEIGRKGEGAMRIAVTYEEGMVGQHFGRTQQFKLYDVADGAIVSSQVVGTGGKGHGALAGVLKVADVDALICGGIGMGARVALSEAGIQLFPGVTGSADEAAAALVAGTLDADLDATCDHHGHGEGHDCHHHGSGCGDHGCHE